MFTARRPALAAWLIGGLVCAGLLPSGCKPSAGPGTAAPKRTPDATYRVRGRVEAIPTPGDVMSRFLVKHEAIHDFRRKDGKVVGMGSMIMEFPPADGVSLEGIVPGDIVELTFSQWWGDTPPWLAMKVVKLPAETQLVFEAARPPQPSQPEAPKK